MAELSLVQTPSIDQEAGEDIIPGLIARWFVIRAEMRLYWAKRDEAQRFGTRSGKEIEFPINERIEEMRDIEKAVMECPPETGLVAEKMLAMALDILAERERDPEAILGEGPGLEIIRQVESALGWLDAHTPLNPTLRRAS